MIVSVLAALSALAITLVAPVPPFDEVCGGVLRSVFGRHYVDGCDYIAFWYLAEDPSRLLEPGEMRQTRPLFILFGLAGRAFGSLVANLFGLEGETVPTGLGYTAVNVVLLASAVWLAGWLLRRLGVSWAIIAAVTAVLVVNNVVKTYVWTAHTQMFQILAPLILLAATIYLLGPVGRARRLGVAVSLGMLVLASGLFLAALPIMLAARYLSSRPDRSKLWSDFGLITLVFALPTLVWMAVARAAAGSFYVHEVSVYNQFVWIFNDEPWMDKIRFAIQFGSTFRSVEVWPFVLAGLVAGVFVLTRSPRSETAKRFYTACLITLAGLAGLLWLIGLYHVRLTTSLVPVLACFLAVELERVRGWLLYFGLMLLAGAWVVLHVIQRGPGV
ncbi:MAG: hypothetical protein ACRDWS_09460 [Acidimicrobiia bacterium]